MRWARATLRLVLVSVGIVVLTSFTIDATDSFRSSNTALSILAGAITAIEQCPVGTIEIVVGDEAWCIDRYENSPSAECPDQLPASSLVTQTNIAALDCQAESKPDAVPWTHVTYHQAKELCAARGMQLPSNAVWYELALGTPDTTAVCNLSNNAPAHTGSNSQCQSARGAHDAVGNVWEWVDASVEKGVYQNRTVPEQGYVADIDVHGVATLTTSTPQTLMHEDYFWADATGNFAMMRGGYYGSEADGGIYSVHAKVAPTFSSAAIGFRCVSRLPS